MRARNVNQIQMSVPLTGAGSASEAGRPLSSEARAVVAIVLVGIAARLIVSATIGLGVDESYAVVVARGFSWSYFDHPPLAFWIAGGLAHLAGTENHVLLRLPFILLFAGTTWLTFRLTARLYGERAGMFAALLLNLAPVFSLSTGSWILPDGPLDCAMVAAALALTHALLDPPSRSTWRWWLLAGVASGLALLSKYHGAFLLLGTTAFVLTRREARAWLARPEPYVATLIALAIFSPTIFWNAAHGFVSFRFQGGRAVPEGGNAVTALLQNLGGQAGYLLPWIWVPLVFQMYRAARIGPRDAPRWLLLCLGAGPVLVFTLVSLSGNPGLPHWEAPGYLLLLPLVGDAAARWETRGPRQRARLHRWLVAAGVVFVALTAVATSDVATGWVARLEPGWFPRGDPSLEAYDWSDLKSELATRGLLEDPGQVIAATHWIDAAKIGYAMGPDYPVLCLSDDPRHFAYADPPARFVGRNVLILVRVPTGGLTRDVIKEYLPDFASIVPAGTVPVMRGGREAFQVAVFRGTELRVSKTLPLPLRR